MKWLFVLLLVVGLGSCVPTLYIVNKSNDMVPARAHLVDAYSTFDRCGSKGRYSCEVFKGRFYLPDHQLSVDKPIDGFTYKSFKEAGNMAPMGTETFYRSTLEGEPSKWVFWLGMLGSFCLAVFFALGFVKAIEKDLNGY